MWVTPQLSQSVPGHLNMPHSSNEPQVVSDTAFFCHVISSCLIPSNEQQQVSHTAFVFHHAVSCLSITNRGWVMTHIFHMQSYHVSNNRWWVTQLFLQSGLIMSHPTWPTECEWHCNFVFDYGPSFHDQQLVSEPETAYLLLPCSLVMYGQQGVRNTIFLSFITVSSCLITQDVSDNVLLFFSHSDHVFHEQ